METTGFPPFRNLDRYAFPIRTTAQFDKSESEITGSFTLQFGYSQNRMVAWPRLTFDGPNIELEEDNSGRFSLRGWGEPIPIEALDEVQVIETKVDATLLADNFMLDPEDPSRFRLEKFGTDLYLPTEDAIERFIGVVSGEIHAGDRNDGTDFYFSSGQFQLQSESGRRISQINFEAEGPLLLESQVEPPIDLKSETAVEQLASFSTVQDALDADWRVVRRRKLLRIQRVFFSDKSRQTGSRSDEQIAAAQTIWGKACIAIQEEMPPIVISNSELVDSADVEHITTAYTPQEPVIPIFFVDNPLISHRGGIVTAPGTSLARVVVTDHISGRDVFDMHDTENPNLTAHEIGHVLGGIHPTEKDNRFWTAVEPTVLKPSGVAHEPNSDQNHLQNCLKAYNFLPDPEPNSPVDCVPQPDQI